MVSARRSTRSLADQLRDALTATDLSNYAICQLTQVDQATLSRFRSGETTITLETAGKLCTGLGLSVRIGRR